MDVKGEPEMLGHAPADTLIRGSDVREVTLDMPVGVPARLPISS